MSYLVRHSLVPNAFVTLYYETVFIIFRSKKRLVSGLFYLPVVRELEVQCH
jgi:hypothetical protein